MLSCLPSGSFGKVDVFYPEMEAVLKIFCIPANHPPGLGFHKAWSTNMHSVFNFHTFAKWFFEFESYGPAILVTVGAALLMACGIGAACSPCEEKDEVFHRQVF
jgi:hypothetical protein